MANWQDSLKPKPVHNIDWVGFGILWPVILAFYAGDWITNLTLKLRTRKYEEGKRYIHE